MGQKNGYVRISLVVTSHSKLLIMRQIKILCLYGFFSSLSLFAKQRESYYQEKFAKEIGGRVEVVLKDGTRCDIETNTHAIEVDFAAKWAESIGQCLHYSSLTGKKPGVALIILDPSDNKYISRVKRISSDFNLGIEIYKIDGQDTPDASAKKRAPGEKEYWITSSGKTHNKECYNFGTTKTGKYSDQSSGINCKICGGVDEKSVPD